MASLYFLFNLIVRSMVIAPVTDRTELGKWSGGGEEGSST